MGELDIKSVINNKNDAINKLDKYLNMCIGKDEKHLKKANLLSYWLKNYIDYIEQEKNFNPSSLKEYSYGDVIKVNLGFNIGNEEGGLHYCVVIDKKNAKIHSTLTVIPLTSHKPQKPINKHSVYLDNELHKKIVEKGKSLILPIDKERIGILQNKVLGYCMDQNCTNPPTKNEIDEFIKTAQKIQLADKILNEANQMKKGTIALVNQITTISKQRIYNPKNELDILTGIKFSDEKMKLINEKIKKLYVI